LDSLTKEFPIPPERWYAIRDRFNHLKDRPTPSLERAALFAYLNKTCFNGLYRVNKEGNFNVPMGQYKRPPSFVGVREMSLPSSIQPPFVSTAMDFEAFVEKAREEFCGEEVFVYFDPPYHRTFSGYCDGDFRESDHRRLRHLCAKLSHDGLSWAVSNSDTPFIRKLYEGCKCLDISVSRTNGAKPSSRGKTNELLILPR
jgi:DNA adenine methylase